MQVLVEDLSSVKKILHIEVSEENVKNELDKAYKNLKKTAKVKGFRPGKTPRSVLERLFHKNVHADVSALLIQDTIVKAIQETKLKIVGNPDIQPPEFNGKGPYKYDAVVEIMPELKEIDFKGLNLTRSQYQINDEEINTQIKMLQKNLAQQEPVQEDRPLAEADFALIDYEGFKDDKPFAETKKTKNHNMRIGDGSISKELDSGMIGMKPGDKREIKVTFPENYYNKKLSNLEITFYVTLNEIREEILPDIDDEFAKKIGAFETLDDLKKSIADNMLQGYAKRSEQELNEQIFKALIEKQDFEVPKAMVDFELEGIMRDTEMVFAQNNMSIEQLGVTKEQFAEKYRDLAVKQVKRHLILNKVIEQESMTLSDEALEEGFNDMTEAHHMPVEELKKYYSENKEKLEYFKHALLEKQALGLIVKNSTIIDSEPDKQKESKSEL